MASEGWVKTKLRDLEYKVNHIKQGDIKYRIGENTDETTNEIIIENSSTSTFLADIDTPTSYTGSGSFYVRVNTAADGLEFVSSSGTGGGGYPLNHLVVASAGGDYTTLGAALNSISGDSTRIFIKDGTYIETADISFSWSNNATNYIEIIGESENVYIDFNSASNSLEFKGNSTAYITIRLSNIFFQNATSSWLTLQYLNKSYFNFSHTNNYHIDVRYINKSTFLNPLMHAGYKPRNEFKYNFLYCREFLGKTSNGYNYVYNSESADFSYNIAYVNYVSAYRTFYLANSNYNELHIGYINDSSYPFYLTNNCSGNKLFLNFDNDSYRTVIEGDNNSLYFNRLRGNPNNSSFASLEIKGDYNTANINRLYSQDVNNPILICTGDYNKIKTNDIKQGSHNGTTTYISGDYNEIKTNYNSEDVKIAGTGNKYECFNVENNILITGNKCKIINTNTNDLNVEGDDNFFSGNYFVDVDLSSSNTNIFVGCQWDSLTASTTTNLTDTTCCNIEY